MLEKNETLMKNRLVSPEQKVYPAEVYNFIERKEELRWNYQRRFKKG
jgi:hypothetical protein